MAARSVVALLAIAHALAQPHNQAKVYVLEEDLSSEHDDVEKRYTAELVQELESARMDALVIYTEFSGRAGNDFRDFLDRISRLTHDTIGEMDEDTRKKYEAAPDHCQTTFRDSLKQIEYNAHRGASFAAENHHKFFLGHMIVFQMHLNKSENHINKCQKMVRGCGTKCETTPQMLRWRRLASNELHRVRDDILHARLYYRDILTHYHRKLNHLRRKAIALSREQVEKLVNCVNKDFN